MRWRDWLRNPIDGAVTQIAFERVSPSKQIIHARTIHSGEAISKLFDRNHEESTEGTIAERVRGHTQAHKVKVASIPVSLYWHLRRTLGDPRDPECNKKWKAWLNDPENRHFRTAEGTL